MIGEVTVLGGMIIVSPLNLCSGVRSFGVRFGVAYTEFVSCIGLRVAYLMVISEGWGDSIYAHPLI